MNLGWQLDARDAALVAAAFARFVLLAARLLPLCLIAPFALLGTAPNLITLALLTVLTLCLWPVAQAGAALPGFALPVLLAFCAREALLGLAYALALGVPLRALEWAGAIAGRASGIPGAARSYAGLQLAFGVAAFFALGGHRLALSALALSLVHHPLGVPVANGDLRTLALFCARLFSDAFSLAVLLALPVSGALALSELGLALATRVTPALFFALAPLRGLLALALLALSALALAPALPDLFARSLHAAQHALGGR